MLPYLTEGTYINGTVETDTKPRYMENDIKPFKSGGFVSTKVSPGLSEFDANLSLEMPQLILSNNFQKCQLMSRRINTR